MDKMSAIYKQYHQDILEELSSMTNSDLKMGIKRKLKDNLSFILKDSITNSSIMAKFKDSINKELEKIDLTKEIEEISSNITKQIKSELERHYNYEVGLIKDKFKKQILKKIEADLDIYIARNEYINSYKELKDLLEGQ